MYALYRTPPRRSMVPVSAGHWACWVYGPGENPSGKLASGAWGSGPTCLSPHVPVRFGHVGAVPRGVPETPARGSMRP
jgi:hypothetical protein